MSEELKTQIEQTYWQKRSNFMYYHYVKFMVRALAHNADSLIDVGSSNAEYIESFDWIPTRHTLDLSSPYQSQNVKGFEMDFLDFKPDKKYDFVTCLQVLEHIPDAVSFAKKLFEIGERILISVPFMWDENSEEDHIHDPVDLNKLVSWVGREPDYYIIVQEPLFSSKKNKRLICYYHIAGEKINVNNYRKHGSVVDKTPKTQLATVNDLILGLYQSNQKLEDSLQKIGARLEAIITKQIEKDERVNLELEIQKVTERLELQKKQNNLLNKEIVEQQKTLKQIKRNNEKTRENTEKYKTQINAILNSNSWKVTKPLRALFRIFKR